MVFVLDTNKRTIAPCHEAVARKMLKKGKAAIYRRLPFTIILKKSV
ncbi:HNH endonuclease, partial [Anoxybacillus flavithermus]